MDTKINFKKSLREQYLEIENATLLRRISSLEQQLKSSQEELYIDSLTKVGNRKKFDEYLNNEVMHLSRSRNKEYLSIVLIDLDGFKQINDTNGHSAGDKILFSTGAVLKSAFSRNIDIVCRYGGDEFAIILPNTTKDGAEIAVGMARRLAEQSNIQMSIGISTINSTAIHQKPIIQVIKDMFEAADADMYNDKSSRKAIALRR